MPFHSLIKIRKPHKLSHATKPQETQEKPKTKEHPQRGINTNRWWAFPCGRV